MKPTLNGALIMVAAMSTSNLYADETSHFSGRVDVSYTEANPDFSPFPNGEGVSVYGRIEYDETWLASYRQTNASFQPSGPVSGDDVDIWRELGVGFHHAFNETWAVEGLVSYQQIDQGSNDESGHELQLGVSLSPSRVVEFDLSVGQLDLQIDDWNLDFETRVNAYKDFYLTAKLRDYADWDFTYYELGMGIYF